MRIVLTLVALSLLGGCSLWMPRHDPSQAWIELDPAADMQALAVDGRELDDGRYFQISPGSHSLDVRYRFEVSGATSGAAARRSSATAGCACSTTASPRAAVTVWPGAPMVFGRRSSCRTYTATS